MLHTKRSMLIAALIAISVALSGCISNPDRQDLAAFGAIAGAAVGAQHNGVTGAIIGGLAGWLVTDSLLYRYTDDADRERAARFAHERHSHPQGTYHDSWRTRSGMNLRTEVVIGPAFENYGRTCRWVQQRTDVLVDGTWITYPRERIQCLDRYRGWEFQD